MNGRDVGQPDNEAKFATLRREAQALGFYSGHDQAVDFISWSRDSFWSADEAIALFFGFEPIDVNWDVLEQAAARNALAGEISRLRKILKRVQSKGDLQPNEYPHNFAAWATLRRIEIPNALVAAISEFGRPIPDWDQRVALQQVADRKKAVPPDASSDSRQEDGDKELSKSERRVAKTIIIAMAVKKYGYKPSERGPIPTQIVNHANELGLSIDDNTVRTWLAKSARLLQAGAH